MAPDLVFSFVFFCLCVCLSFNFIFHCSSSSMPERVRPWMARSGDLESDNSHGRRMLCQIWRLEKNRKRRSRRSCWGRPRATLEGVLHHPWPQALLRLPPSSTTGQIWSLHLPTVTMAPDLVFSFIFLSVCVCLSLNFIFHCSSSSMPEHIRPWMARSGDLESNGSHGRRTPHQIWRLEKNRKRSSRRGCWGRPQATLEGVLHHPWPQALLVHGFEASHSQIW